MPAIVKEKHHRFCKMMEDFRFCQSQHDHALVKLKAELNEIFDKYQHMLNDLRTFTLEYEVKQKVIRQRMKQLLRKELVGKNQAKQLDEAKD